MPCWWWLDFKWYTFLCFILVINGLHTQPVDFPDTLQSPVVLNLDLLLSDVEAHWELNSAIPRSTHGNHPILSSCRFLDFLQFFTAGSFTDLVWLWISCVSTYLKDILYFCTISSNLSLNILLSVKLLPFGTYW